MKFIREIFSNDSGRGSNTGFNATLGVIMGGITVMYMAYGGTLNEWIFGIFMAATGGVYGWVKQQDASVRKEQIKADPTPNVVIPNSEKVEIKTDVTNVDSSKTAS